MTSIATNRTVAACMANGSTNIPVRKSLSRSSSNNSGAISPISRSNSLNLERELDRVKHKFEDSENKRKSLINRNEKSKSFNIYYNYFENDLENYSVSHSLT